MKGIKRIIRAVRIRAGRLLDKMLVVFPFYRTIVETRDTQTPVMMHHYITQKILRINSNAYWPMHHSSKVYRTDNIIIGVETCPGYMPGCYIQAEGRIEIGDYTQIGPAVGLISTNHDVGDNRVNVDKGGIKIGEYCWLGMGSKILSGIHLGDFTIVGANAVVTKSFPEGYCVIAGNPAKLIRKLDPEKCIRHRSGKEYIGFYTKEKFRQKRGQS